MSFVEKVLPDDSLSRGPRLGLGRIGKLLGQCGPEFPLVWCSKDQQRVPLPQPVRRSPFVLGEPYHCRGRFTTLYLEDLVLTLNIPSLVLARHVPRILADVAQPLHRAILGLVAPLLIRKKRNRAP